MMKFLCPLVAHRIGWDNLGRLLDTIRSECSWTSGEIGRIETVLTESILTKSCLLLLMLELIEQSLLVGQLLLVETEWDKEQTVRDFYRVELCY